MLYILLYILLYLRLTTKNLYFLNYFIRFLFKMDEMIMYEFIECMRIILSRQELLFNTQLKLISSRTERTSVFIDSTIKFVTKFLKYHRLRFKMYNIKIFTEDIYCFKTKHNISVPAMCYNCFLVNTDFSSQYLLRNDMRFGHIIDAMPTLSPYLFIQVIY